MQWNPKPSLWQQIVQIGPFWLVVAFAGIAGVAAARLIIVPHDGPCDLGRADKLALWRTWVGFGVVAFTSRPYRSPTETVDKALGNFNTSVPVSLGVYLVLIIIFWFTIKAQSRTNFGRELRSAFSRCVTFFLVLALSWWILAVFLSRWDTPGEGSLGLVLLGGFVGLYSSGAWCISRYWFGIGRAHPLLPPAVTAETICIMTAVELHSGGPERLPPKPWLMINFAAVITTLCVCFVEACDAYAETRSGRPHAPGASPAQWPMLVAAYLGIFALAFSVVFIWTGDAQRTLCTGTAPIVKCTSSG